MYVKHATSVFHIVTYAIILVLVLPALVQHGMFMDGTQYACVARNLALGEGTFWFPHLSDSWLKNGASCFMEHLPLAYYLQSNFFLVFGESIYTERIYCFTCLLVSVALIHAIWQILPFENEVLKRNSWLPLLLWITCGSVFWAYQNNMLEITVSVFTLASLYFMLRVVYCANWRFLNLVICGTCILFASLSKGLPGLFPLAAPVLFYLTLGKWSIRTALLYNVMIIAVPLAAFLFLFFFDTVARESIEFYLANRLFYRLVNDPLVENRFTVLFWLFTDMLLPLFMLTLLLIVYKFKKIKQNITSDRKKLAIFFILLGFCGVIPLTLTLVQRAVYFIPALPFFAIGFSLLVVNGIDNLKNRLNITRHYKKIRYSAFFILVGVLIYCMLLTDGASRDEGMLEDVKRIGARVPPGTHINVPVDVYESWNFQFYLLRYNKIVLWQNPDKRATYYLSKKPAPAEIVKNYHPIDIGLNEYELFAISQ